MISLALVMANNSARVIFLDEISSGDLSLVGGKAMSLGEMIKAGMNVPSAFCVSTHIFKSGLNPEIEKEILEAFDKLGAQRVAVRSSAVAEDSKEASWAGQLETYLNVDKSGLIDAIRKCWDSVNSEHAREYAKQQNIADAGKAVGVVVQKMVDSEVSGVMFTANPITNNRGEILIEAIYGLGELLVQGAVTPEGFIINKHSGEIISNSKNRQTKMLVYKDGKNQELEVLPAKLKNSLLTETNLKDLIRAAAKLEKHYGLPQDIEWAIAGGKLYITQSRPITTLSDKPKDLNLEQEFLEQNGGDNIMRFEGDFIPFQLMIEWWSYIGPQYKVKSISPVLFYFTPKRTTAFLSHKKYNGAAKETFADLVNGKLPLQDFKDGYEKFAARISEKYTDHFQEGIKPETEDGCYELYKAAYDDFHALVLWTLFYEQLDEATVAEVLADKDVDLKKLWEMVKLPTFKSLDTRKKEYVLEALKGEANANYLKFVFTDYTFFPDEKFVSNKLKEYDTAELKADIEKADKITAQAKQQLDEYLSKTDEYMENLIDVLVWVLFCRDERKYIINKAELLLFHISQQLFEFWGIDKSLVGYAGISDVLQGGDYMKSIAQDLPKRPDGFSVLYQADGTSVFGYENLEEQISSLDGFILSQHKSKDGRTLTGEIGNVGQASGKVRIIRKNAEFDTFQAGEILVTGMTRPEFVPLMQKAAGIITDEGGITSHAAIVSRELNKPCIIGTRIATQVLKDGDEVEVDANTGLVTIV